MPCHEDTYVGFNTVFVCAQNQRSCLWADKCPPSRKYPWRNFRNATFATQEPEDQSHILLLYRICTKGHHFQRNLVTHMQYHISTNSHNMYATTSLCIIWKSFFLQLTFLLTSFNGCAHPISCCSCSNCCLRSYS